MLCCILIKIIFQM